MIAVVGGLVVVGLVAVGLGIRWWTFDPAPELRALVESVPPPPGLHPTGGAAVEGDRPSVCSLEISCKTQVASVVWTAADPRTDVCQAIRDAASTSWRDVGFEVSPPDPRVTETTCAVDGTLHGHPAGAQVSPSGGSVTFAARW